MSKEGQRGASPNTRSSTPPYPFSGPVEGVCDIGGIEFTKSQAAVVVCNGTLPAQIPYVGDVCDQIRCLSNACRGRGREPHEEILLRTCAFRILRCEAFGYFHREEMNSFQLHHLLLEFNEEEHRGAGDCAQEQDQEEGRNNQVEPRFDSLDQTAVARVEHIPSTLHPATGGVCEEYSSALDAHGHVTPRGDLDTHTHVADVTHSQHATYHPGVISMHSSSAGPATVVAIQGST